MLRDTHTAIPAITCIKKENLEEFSCMQVITRLERKTGEIKYETSNHVWWESSEIFNNKKNLEQGDWICLSHEDSTVLGLKELQFEKQFIKKG